ncbi:hypothetical protein IWW36_000531 [Coemansia brasiliensis]|uniref:Protein kinase domain-containing protein n=1 Tax=Coemansia brasiliensis TaxID=2650707 RepID=A0A9W8IIK4_9FUNG|nr:hypothetical protein IWW36_000531 [Coemansia brasiliensis]
MSEPQTPTRSETVSTRQSFVSLDSSKIHRRQSVQSVGNFIIDKTLAEKPGTKVCLARHKKTKKNLALKFIKLEGQPEKRLVRYQREVNNLALLHHPHIAKLLDAVQTERFAMLVCEYAVRGDLLNYSREQGRMNEDEARRIFRQLVSAVDYLHKNCIVHRKITLETVLLDNDRNVKLVGFGRSNSFKWSRLLDTYCGSPFFCSPEMVQGIEYTGPEVDIWSMGVILYYVLAGTPPFKGEMLHDVYDNISKGEYAKLDNSSPEVRDLLARIFVVDRSKRITMQEIIEHEWICKGYDEPVNNYMPSRAATVLNPNEDTLQKMAAFGYSAADARAALAQRQHASTPIVCVYHLLEETRQRAESRVSKSREMSRTNTTSSETAKSESLNVNPPDKQVEETVKRSSQFGKVWKSLKQPAAKLKNTFNRKSKE